MLKRIIGHELGHAIGLYHPWQNEGTGRERGEQQSLSVRGTGTIMDWGATKDTDYNEHRDAQTFLGELKGAKVYPSYHIKEFIFVSPSKRTEHLDKVKEYLKTNSRRKSKPQWFASTQITTQNQQQQPPNDDSQDPGSQNTQPNTPTDLRTTFGNGQVRLSWTAGGGTTTDYEYRYRESGGSWREWVSALLSKLHQRHQLTLR